MSKKYLTAMMIAALGTGAAQAGPYCGKMKGAYHHPMMAPTATFHNFKHPHAGYYAMVYAAHHGGKAEKMMTDERAKKSPVAADIVDTAVAAGSFETLVKAVQEAGLVDKLRGKGPFTVFAPTDEAFAQLPEGTLGGLLADKEKLAKVLTYHVVPGKVMAADLIGKNSVDTVEGTALSVDSIEVSKADIETSNGVIHIIDKVLIPSG